MFWKRDEIKQWHGSVTKVAQIWRLAVARKEPKSAQLAKGLEHARDLPPWENEHYCAHFQAWPGIACRPWATIWG